MRLVLILLAASALVACQPPGRPLRVAPPQDTHIPSAPPQPVHPLASAPMQPVGPRPPHATLPSTPELRDAVADASVTVEIKTALAQDRELQAIDVDTVNGTVVLRGPVASPWARDRAMWLTASVQGVRLVDDDLRIETPVRR